MKVRAFLKQRWTAIDELITELHVQARRAVIDEAQVGDIHGAFGPFAKGITVRGKVAIDHLKPYPRNARTHSRTQLQQIADSIRRFGFVNPPLVDDNGQIIAGHGRVEAAKLLGLTEVPILRVWLQAVSPALASPLVVICSVVSQSQTLPRIWHAIDFRRLWPLIVGGLLGVPIGALLLTYVEPRMFKLAMGGLLLVYATTMLWGNYAPRIAWGGRIADGFVGFGGGILGGLAGLSGPLTIWAAVRGWDKETRRAVFQGFNFPILCVALAVYAAAGLLNAELWRLVLVALPGTMTGAWTGSYTYRRMSDLRFHRFVLWLLIVSGLTLLWTSR